VDGRLQDGDQGAFEKAVELEYRYAEDTMPRGVLGMNASMFKGYLRYIANRRATQIGLEALFPTKRIPSHG
jgi:ribonucleoside-diphosphate reductase beta chain